MKYLNAKKTLIILAVNTLAVFVLWMLPTVFESMLLQKIVVITLTVAGILLAFLFMLVNGMTTSLTDGAYEKEYYSHLKNGTALDEGQNLRYNPFRLSLCRRIYWAKLIMLFLTPIVVAYLFECISMLLENFL
ncbi:MAG: hypothetical protein IKV53_01595 [Clostridia bacterium]|nr:hypothetical protein [Clostridia bacterium]